MVTALRPGQGGFLRPFGCGWFIREFLLGHGPEGSPRIDPSRGAPQADIRFHYKEALYHAFARDSAEHEISARVLAGEKVTEEEARRIHERYFGRIPYKLTKCRYHSFLVYFGMLKRLGWVEATGRVEEPSGAQEAMALEPGESPRFAGQPRIYYRLTNKGKTAPDPEWSNPLITLYPQFPPEYFREKRRGKKYVRA